MDREEKGIRAITKDVLTYRDQEEENEEGGFVVT